MDVIKNLGGKDANTQQTSDQSGGGLLDTLHGAVGGGRQSEKNEDGVDKGIPSFFQYTSSWVVGCGLWAPGS